MLKERGVMARGGLSGVIDPIGEIDSLVSNAGNKQTAFIHKNFCTEQSDLCLIKLSFFKNIIIIFFLVRYISV